VEINHVQFHRKTDQAAFSYHPDLPAAANVGFVDCQSDHRRDFERLCRCASCLAAAAGPQAYAAVHGAIASWIGQVVLVGCAFVFFMHLCGGIRHLVWDTGYGFELRSIYASGWTVVVASVVLTVAAWVASLLMAG
jgi:succinate dehydrogenase / fumarate reductase cytochrome b subunit